MRAHAAREQGVAVRVRGGHPRAADRAARAANILDDHGLSEDFSHLLGHDARHDVTGAAGGERHDHCDGPRRIALRARTEWYGKQT